MADDPEIALDLKDLKSGQYARVKVTYKDLKSSGRQDHRVGWSRLADEWLSWSFNNRLELTWRSIPKEILAQDDNPFPVKPKGVPSSTGDVKLEWKVWAKSQEITNHNHVELYSVMRAEEWHISRGSKKIASKYYCDAHGPSENFGVDSFFRLGGDQYVACESKFTRNESEFSDWMKMSKRKKEEWIWQNKLKKYKGVIPMSWEWVEDRALRAVEDPPVELIDRTEAQNRAVIVEVREMAKAVRKPKNVTRKVNFYGAEDVPIYPGRYRFMCAERTKLSKNLLHLKWTLKVEGSEFIDLDERFDEWVEGRT